MNTTMSMTNQHTHPPIALSSPALIDRAARNVGLALIRWARRSELLRSRRLAGQRERAARQHELEQFRTRLAAERTVADAYLLLRSR